MSAPNGDEREDVDQHTSAAQNLPSTREQPKSSGWFRPSIVNVKLIYAGFLCSLAIPPIAILAVVYAHLGRRHQPNSWLSTHYTYQIRTFWIGLVANVIAYLLSFIGVGLLLFPVVAIWVVARAVNGLIAIAQRRPIEDPNSYFV